MQKIVFISHYLMGIGSGSSASESGERVAIKQLLKKNQSPVVVFDIGANQGQFLSLVIDVLGNHNYEIHCFEPAKNTFGKLIENAGSTSNVKFNNIALGMESEKKILYYDHLGSGLASLTKRNISHLNIDFCHSESVDVDTVDNYCKNNLVKNINLLKIDVEGHEMDVLSGAKQIFSQCAVDLVLFEFGGCNIDTRTFFRDFWTFFEEKDMNLYRINPSGKMFLLEAYSESLEQYRTTNFLAVSQA